MATVSTTLPSDGQTIDASDVNTPINAILSEFNGNIDNDNIKTGANINGAKLLASSLPGSSFDTTLAGGWISGGLPAYSSATNNGNKSYDIVFASTVASLLSPGMRLRTTRTVTAPTQCADLEASSSQYFSKASATGFATGTTWTFKAKVKMESYHLGVICSLDDSTNIIMMYVNTNGTLSIAGGTNVNVDLVTSYQSLPLGKWVDVAGSITIGTPTGEIIFDDVVVPSFVTASAATTMTINGDETWNIGRNNGGNYFDGKICQVSVFNAVISAATLKTYSSQTMTGAETSSEGFWSLNGVLTDGNANANTLTASGGALATNADSPFGQDSNGVPSGTTDYALVMKVSTTTATVQVPEGCTIPTSGGVSAVAYSTVETPYGFTPDKGRWAVKSLLRVTLTQTNPVNGTWYNLTSTTGVSGGTTLNVPVGAWQYRYSSSIYVTNATNSTSAFSTLSTGVSTETNIESTTRGTFFSLSGGITGNAVGSVYRTGDLSFSAATPVYLNVRTDQNSTTTIALNHGAADPTIIEAIPSGV